MSSLSFSSAPSLVVLCCGVVSASSNCIVCVHGLLVWCCVVPDVVSYGLFGVVPQVGCGHPVWPPWCHVVSQMAVLAP